MTTILVALYVYIGAQVALYAAINAEEKEYGGGAIFASTTIMVFWPIFLISLVILLLTEEKKP